MTETTIDLTPTWTATARMLRALFDNGTETGREMAFAELERMGPLLDRLIEERKTAPDAVEGQTAGQTFKLHIETDNAAFDVDAGGAAAEVARILRDLADRLSDNGDLIRHASLHDVNGHAVGVATTDGTRWDEEDAE